MEESTVLAFEVCTSGYRPSLYEVLLKLPDVYVRAMFSFKVC